MSFLNKLNIFQKITIFIFLINFFLGFYIYNYLGLTRVWGIDLIFYFNVSGFWWGVNVVSLIGIYLFKDNEE
tara:strand:- start:198 stop:413 length:216 start_codon:yes stop_codon:yes gene_type:complete